jgi:hypothetical protein
MIDDFIPEIWTANILEALRTNLVYGGPMVINRDYEGDIAQAGDTVHITAFGDPTIRTYTPESDITIDSLTDSTQALVIDQDKYFAFDVDDVIRRQALPGWVEQASSRSGYLLAKTADSFLSATMYAAVNNTAYDLGAVTADISDNTAYGNVFVAMWKQLTLQDVPLDGRFVVVSPAVYAALLQDNRFINAQAAGTTDALRNGRVGNIVGFDVFLSNQTPDPTSGVTAVIAGHPMATTYAEQIAKVEADHREKRFGDLVKGLHVYGAKVTRPSCLCLASVTVQA